MSPPTSTDQDTGKVLDGKPRSAQWRDREAERKAAEAREAAEAMNGHSDAATNSRYSPPTGLARSLMIPAELAALDPNPSGEPADGRSRSAAHTDASDTYIDKLIEHAAAERNASTNAPATARSLTDSETDTDRFFERQATTPPRGVARQTIAAGTASLTITETPARSRRQLRIRGPRRLTRARENESPPPAPRHARPSGTFAGRPLVLAGCATLLAAIAAAAILANSSPTSPRPGRNANAAIGATRAAHANNPLGGAFGATIATIAPELHALARVVLAARPSSPGQRKPPDHHVSRAGPRRNQQHPTAVSQPRPSTETSTVVAPAARAHTESAPAITPTPETHSYTPPTTGTSSTSHTSAGSQTPATSSSQPAGPTSSDPLGGIGSCVSGCT
jgi:hypothetical protein